MTTAELRENFLISSLFTVGKLEMVYSDVDRVIVGSAVPAGEALKLGVIEELRTEFFLERRELGILNIGANGVVTVDGVEYRMENGDCLYVSRGSKEMTFLSDDNSQPAEFYLASYPAHADHPTTLAKKADAAAVHLGAAESCNVRTIYKYIHPEGIRSCQLVMGYTELAEGSVWNTMPSHTHVRRSEVYMYYDMVDDARVFHYMGEPQETRHLVIGSKEAVISPSWSIHSGSGTAAYKFCWVMGGENQIFDDMDHLGMDQIL
ncbi:5-dehydro-4-deoxy-D-glucuronate isomerase [Persicirhabdus sediminis]|uniref:5-dehydro-4-deoxy-D-glucuronate isomerase n=2 Tax=Persicirhabdus sediminis TaxID=454144 RepID=A0A8J7MBE5_9BACT|nr:5-dehydro-4-deoxy-D-glucuronate isomerase [Persicirhabdus sediminis]